MPFPDIPLLEIGSHTIMKITDSHGPERAHTHKHNDSVLFDDPSLEWEDISSVTCASLLATAIKSHW